MRARVLWISPNLNHYKAKFLNRLVETTGLALHVLAGQELGELGHHDYRGSLLFSVQRLAVRRDDFSTNIEVYRALLRMLREGTYDVVLMPAERKYLPLILFLYVLKFFKGFALISYNHPIHQVSGKLAAISRLTIRLFFGLYDRIVFYTKEACLSSIQGGLLPDSKAYWANNTLDTAGIWSHYSFEINQSTKKALLFIGRLLPNKKLDKLFIYYRTLKRRLPGLRLIVIGGGPMEHEVQQAIREDDQISWKGAVVDERAIACAMREAHIVFVPGDSGLSIVHAFCYGKPYATIYASTHGPEIDYVEDNVNGLVLSGDPKGDCMRIAVLLEDQRRYSEVCLAAFEKAKELSIEHWCSQMARALC